MQPPEMIDAGDLVLKRWEPARAEELAAAVHESLPQFKLFLPWAHDDYDTATAHACIERSAHRWANGTDFNYAIFMPAGDLVGAIGLMTRTGPGVLETGYWTHTLYAGRGSKPAQARSS